MILYGINLKCITVYPFKGDTPWTIDMNTVKLWRSLKPMKIETGDV